MSSPRPQPHHNDQDDIIINEDQSTATHTNTEEIKKEEIKAQVENEILENNNHAQEEQHLLEKTAHQAQERYNKIRAELDQCFFENKHNKMYNTRLVKIARYIQDQTDKKYDDADKTNQATFSALADTLECCVEGIKNPHSVKNFNRTSNLAANSETQASLGKKVVGGLLLFVGILSVLAFGALVLATHGVALAALPVIGPAVTTGLAWMGAAATALGVSAEILTFAGLGFGTAATVSGTALAISGQSRGLARSMYSFHNELNYLRKKDEAANHDYMNESEKSSLLVQ